MKDWWINLSLREKQILSVGSIFVIIFLLYEIIWAPLSSHNEFLRDKIRHDQTLLIWMQEASQRIQATQQLSKKNISVRNPAAQLSLLQKEVNQSPFAKNLLQINQAENNSVQLTFQKINFDALIKWLTELWKRQGLTVSQITITPNGSLGIVDVSAVLG